MLWIDIFVTLASLHTESDNFTVYLVNSELFGNAAADGSGLYLGVQTICISIIKIIIEQCLCHNNNGEYGSGMYISSELTINKLWVWINDVTFAGNIAKFAGGAIFIDWSLSDEHLRICDATFFDDRFAYFHIHSKCSIFWRNSSVHPCTC